MAKDPAQKDVLETVLRELLEGIRQLAVCLWPVIPGASLGMLKQLGLDTACKEQKLHSGKSVSVPAAKLLSISMDSPFVMGEPTPLFPRIEKPLEKTS